MVRLVHRINHRPGGPSGEPEPIPPFIDKQADHRSGRINDRE